MADIVIVVIIALAALAGYKKGLVRSVFNLGYHVAALIVSALLYPAVTNWLRDTKLYTVILTSVEEKIAAGKIINIDNIPQMFRAAVQSGADAAVRSTAESVTNLAITVIAIVAVFVIVKCLLSLISGVLTSVSKLPVLSGVNRLCGFAVGALAGAIAVYLLLALTAAFPESAVYTHVVNGALSKEMFDNNLILKFVLKI